MKKKSVASIFFSVSAIVAIGIVGIKIAFNKQDLKTAHAAEPVTNLNLNVLGDAVRAIDSAWDNGNGIPMTQTSPSSGVYTATIFSKGGQVIVTTVGSWGDKDNPRYYFADVDDETKTALGASIYSNKDANPSGDDNICLSSESKGYYKFTVDTTKDSKKLNVQCLCLTDVLYTIAGDGVAGGAWNCSSKDYLFGTEDGTAITTTIKTVPGKSWRLVEYNTSWQNNVNYLNLDSGCDCYGEFGNGGANDYNIVSLKNRYYTVTINPNADADKKISIERIFGNSYDTTNTIYYAPGPNYVWSNGAKVYGWTSQGANVKSGWPGDEMTYEGFGIYSFTYSAAEMASIAGLKFSEKNNDGNQTGNVYFTDGNNLYIYEGNHYATLNNSMLLAEAFAEDFLSITDSACSALNVTSGVWSKTKRYAVDLLADNGAKAIALSGQGVFMNAGFDDDEDTLGLAVSRYDFIIGKYHFADEYLKRFEPALGGTNKIGSIINSDNATIILIASLSVSLLVCCGFVFLKKKKESK